MYPRQQGGMILWTPVDESILDSNENPAWYEHPTFKRKVDVVALELNNTNGFDLRPYETNPPQPRIRIAVTERLSVIGFPFGQTAGGIFGIWTSGTIASEPTVDFNDLPSFLIDARTREGQSGSPVISYSSGGGVQTEDGSTTFMGEIANLQGVYSGRINSESDIGIVWKREVIDSIIDGLEHGSNSFT